MVNQVLGGSRAAGETGDEDVVAGNGGNDGRMEDPVVAEGLRPRIGPLLGVDDRTEGVEAAADGEEGKLVGV